MQSGPAKCKATAECLGCVLGGDEEVEVFEVASGDCGAANHCQRRKARGWCGVLGVPWEGNCWSDPSPFLLPPAALLQQISVLQPSHILDGASRLVSSQSAWSCWGAGVSWDCLGTVPACEVCEVLPAAVWELPHISRVPREPSALLHDPQASLVRG